MTAHSPSNWRLVATCFLLTSLILGMYMYNWSDYVWMPISSGFVCNNTKFYLNLTNRNNITTQLEYCFNISTNSSKLKQTCGKRFQQKWLPYLERFNYMDHQTAQMTSDDDENILRSSPQFVTAFSDNHFDSGYNMFSSLNKTLFGTKLIVYDLGLSKKHLAMLNVSPIVIAVRRFNFPAYPSYVANLFEYRWKPLLIAEMLQEFPSVFYTDAHVRWQENDFEDLYERIRCRKKSKVNNCFDISLMIGYAGHSIYSATDRRIYSYFPISINATKRLDMGAATLQLVYGTKASRQQVQKWSVLCALEQDCMAPSGTTRFCRFTKDRFNDYARCHRYDQSVISVLLAIRNKFEVSKYIVNFNYTRD